MTMTEREAPSYGERYLAEARVLAAKRKMDDAQAAFETAEAEWLLACIDRDKLEGLEIPTAAEMRGILRHT